MDHQNLQNPALPGGYEKKILWVDFGKISEWLLYLAIFLLPFWTLPYTILPTELNKSYLGYFIITLAIIFYLISVLKEGVVRVAKNWIFVAALSVVFVFALASFFSQASHVSFLGMGHETGTLAAVVFFALTFIFSSAIINSASKAGRAVLFLLSSFIVLFVLQIFHSFFGLSLFSWLGAERTANTMGSWNELGILAGLIFILSVILIEVSDHYRVRALSSLALIFSFLMLALVNSGLVLWTTAALMLVYLAYVYSSSGKAREVLGPPLGALIAIVLLIGMQTYTAGFLTRFNIQFIEVRPSWSSTLEVVSGAIKENPLLGSGPNTFVYDWFKYRPADINLTPFWQARFSSGVGLLPTFFAFSGVLGILSLISFLFLFLWSGFKAFILEGSRGTSLITAIFLGASFLWVIAFTYPVGFFIFFLTFLMSGVFVGLLHSSGDDLFTISLFERSARGFIFALLSVFLIVVSISWLFILGRNYYANIRYGEGVKAFARGNYDRAEGHFLKAVSISKSDRYYRSLNDLYLLRLQQVLSRRDLSADELRTRFQDILGQAVQSAQAAVNLNPPDPLNWASLGRIYEAIAPLRIEGASDFARSAYIEASNRFPSSPELYLAQARIKIIENKLDEARELLRRSIDLKNDYAPAHFLLSQLEVQSGNISSAIQSAEAAVLISPNDIGVLFQLGLLYYQDRRYDDSKIVFERAVTINPNYANALYFLGLVNAREGEAGRALERFERVLGLNPGNSEVEKIISNLREGKEPLSGISPPAPAPENRSSVPVEEGSRETDS